MNEFCLKNGLKILFHSMPNTHSITIGLYIRAGARYETGNHYGITHLLEHIHFRQLGDMSQDDLYYNMERMGSTLRAATYYDFLKFTMKIRPKYLHDCIDIFERILSTYHWSEESLNQEKEVVKKQIDEDDSFYSIKPKIRKHLFGNSEMANKIMGSKESVDSLNLSDLISFKKSVFNKNNMILCITGCVNQSEFQMIKNKLECVEILDGEKKIISQPCSLLFERKPTIIFEHDSWNYMEVEISFDIDYKHTNIEKLRILNCILGEGVGSRLQRQVRERLTFTSDIYSELETYEDFAVLHIRFSVQKKELLECLSHVFQTIEELKHGITSKDLAVSLPFYSDNLMFLEDDTEEMNYVLAYHSFVLEHQIQVLEEDGNDLINCFMECAKRIFIPKNTSVIIFGNCNHITKKSIREIISRLDSTT